MTHWGCHIEEKLCMKNWGIKDSQEFLKGIIRQEEKRSRVKNSMASKEYCKERHHLMLISNTSNSVSEQDTLLKCFIRAGSW